MMPLVVKYVLLFICSLVIISLVVWKYLKLELVRVDGDSMYPTLLHGRPILIRKRLNVPQDLVVGRIYTYTSPRGYAVIKRLTEVRLIKGELWLYFLGDNPNHSEDSRHYGYVKIEALEGIVVFNKEQKIA